MAEHDETTRTTMLMGSTPVPDPTVLTSEALARSEKAIHEWVDGQIAVRDERLSGIDEATKLRLLAIVEIPHQIDEKVGRLADVHGVRFDAIQTQFRERDARADRESQLNKIALDAAFSASKEAVAAAFAAQKEDANRRDEANGKAIDKSERATAETIKTNQELSASKTDALAKSIDELKERLTRIESMKVGATETRTGLYAVLAATGAVIGVVLSIVAFVAGRGGA